MYEETKYVPIIAHRGGSYITIRSVHGAPRLTRPPSLPPFIGLPPLDCALATATQTYPLVNLEVHLVHCWTRRLRDRTQTKETSGLS